MSHYLKYKAKPTEFLALTGYTLTEFEALLPAFGQSWEQWLETHTFEGKSRQKRRAVSYNNSPLPTIADKLFFILVYFKSNHLQQIQGTLFNLSQPKANRWIHALTPHVKAALAQLGELPARDLSALTSLSDPLYFHDGTERPIPRPTDPEKQTQHYSGKKKRHSLKNNLLTAEHCQVIYLSPTVEGKKHDKKLADETPYPLPAGSRLAQDTGFQGFVLAEVIILQAKKKPKGQPLTEGDKHLNSWHAALRVRMEHVIGGVKRYRIVQDKIRCWKKGFRDLVMEICCGLHNFRLNFRPWHYPPLQLHLGANF